jgi:hypothetical protein
MRKHIVCATAFFGFSASAHAAAFTNPASLTIKVLEVRLSTHKDCSSSVSVFKPASPSVMDFAAGPTLGSGAIPFGTYHCVAVHLSDIMTVIPAATTDDGLCVAGTSYQQDIFNTPAQGDISVDPVTGATINGTGDPSNVPLETEDDPWIYFSDDPTASSSNNCFQPTVGPNTIGPCVLSALPITANQTRSFVVDFDGLVGSYGDGHCHLHPPVWFIR